ncbi:META domain-containing protein [Actinoplanes couchii]|uniref:DUF306 domain-containing protein n=1 Tax=Actinoplanes couchii TaxID=403638 RepID=A0ABQ3X861_9ACTN|nr:META domain-containing protein [Actinoplanes couchii]MDR6320286.1 hypothetical protein [Actinoplanes couchii]GID54699.1 hypothetical protein Aco03nite_031030 [Actinoplanes couchii]
MTDTSPPRPRTRWVVLAVVAVGALAAVTLGVQRAGAHQDGPGPRAVVSLPPVSPGVAGAGYVGSRWRLTGVTDARGTTEIPESTDAWIELAADGRFVAFDGCNTISGPVDTTSTGFDITDALSTLVGCLDGDPAAQAAIIGMDAMTSGPAGQTIHTTILSADPSQSTVQAGGVRLTFTRSGPAGR